MTDEVTMSAPPVDVETLREEVRDKYRAVAADPGGAHHFHTGRPLADRLGYPPEEVDPLPDHVVAAFAGIGNPFSLRALQPGEHVVDVGSGGGFDALLAARAVGADGAVVGVDMTDAMLARARENAMLVEADNATFVEGFAEQLPVEDGWADVVISNGALNLCGDKQAVFSEIFRVLRPGGHLQFADIANGRPVPEGALRDIDLWTG